MGVESSSFYRLKLRRIAAWSSRPRARLAQVRFLPITRHLSCLGDLSVLSRTLSVPLLGWAFLIAENVATQAASYDGVLTINVAEEGTNDPLAVRMELRKQGRPVRIRPEGAIALDGYLVFTGSVTLELKQGNYEFFIEAGPEYQTRQGHFTIERHTEDQAEVLLTRRVNMRKEGWWAGDLDVSQRFDDLPLLMRAASLDYVPVTVEENDNGKCRMLRQSPNAPISELSPPFFGPWGAIDNRQGGPMLFIARDSLPEVCKLGAGVPSLSTLESTDATAVALSSYAWDLPIWIASGKLTAVGIIHRNALIDKAIDKEANGYPRDKKFYPGAMGNGRWSEAIYHHLLNCGIRIPPAAGSGSGTNGNPIGTNRVYAYCGEQCTTASWLAALKSGQVMVTNGPLLRVKVEGHPPGHVFKIAAGEKRDFQVTLAVTFYERAPVEYLEFLKNGQVVHQVRIRDLAANEGRLPPISFNESGWFAVRAMTSSTNNYQYATTGPYYVERDGQPRISRRSVQFFLDWLAALKVEFPEDSVKQKEIANASAFWEDLRSRANAE